MTEPEPAAPIAHWTDVEGPDDNRHGDDHELLSIGAALGRRLGLTRLGIHHERLPPGRRTSFPHAESAEEECVFVLEGTPDVWLDGALHRLRPGDSVGFPAGTGVAHTFLNDTDAEVRLLVVGEATKAENRIVHPLHPERPLERQWLWADAPRRALGPHDGRPRAQTKAGDPSEALTEWAGEADEGTYRKL